VEPYIHSLLFIINTYMFPTKYVPMFMAFLHELFHMSVSSGTLISGHKVVT